MVEEEVLEKLKEAQKELSKEVVEEDEFEKVESVLGLDVSYKDKRAHACAVNFEKGSLSELERACIQYEVNFPYISGLFYLRELRPLLEVIDKIGKEPDILMVNAKGVEHPRRFGLASHIGFILDKPSIGVTESILCGESLGEPEEKRDYRYIYDKEVVGASFKSTEDSGPIYISVGNKISLDSAIEIVKETLKGHKFPEPLRVADKLSKEFQE